MSGHSHWAGIKHKKAFEDAKRGNLFSKLGKMLSIAARDKGGDPEANPQLRVTIEKAKGANMPNENIERAIKRGTGGLEGVTLEEIILEIYGPEGVAILVEGITDNKNRTLSEIKNILSRHNAKLANEGGVKWMFARKGVISVKSEVRNKEDAELKAIDAGADDMSWDEEGSLQVYASQENLEMVKQNLEKAGLRPESAELAWIPQNPLEATDAQRVKLEKLFEALDDYEDVQEIYSNLK